MATDAFSDQRVNEVLNGLREQVEQLLVLLSQRERHVIEGRFGLEGSERATLEEIGHHFQVTRERVRQIEKSALQKLKRNIDNTLLSHITQFAYNLLMENGQVMREDEMVSAILVSKEGLDIQAILFVLSLDKRFSRHYNTIKLHPHFRMADISERLISDISDLALKTLKDRGDIMSTNELREMIVTAYPDAERFSLASYESFFKIHKLFKKIDDKVGLIEWKHIHPRTLRDKIFFILRKKKAPMHFVDIANEIIGSKFDKKNVNLQAVHNELIRHDGFVLIGRGIYALKEWGFDAGTVADVITDILKNVEHMSENDIIEEVLKRRQVKAITIILNLKNKPQFTRVGRKQYALKK